MRLLGWAALALLLTSGCGTTSPEPPRPPSAPVMTDEAQPAPPTTTPPASPDEMPARILAAHNAWRAEVGVPPLVWSDTLAAFAQDWAAVLQERGCAMEHRGDSPYGENLAWAMGTRLTPERVVDMWGEEQAFYDYATNTCAEGEVCGHYTQVVWASTEAVGCAVGRCADSETWVCNYDPPGNWAGQRPY